MKQYLQRLLSRQHLSPTEIRDLLEKTMSGEASDLQVAAWISLLAAKGETTEEITYLVEQIREYQPKLESASVTAKPGGGVLLDLVGTGGDGLHTLNISTVSALLVAACGVQVAKHGNRSVSSRCGSADLLDAWGIHYQFGEAGNGASASAVGASGVGAEGDGNSGHITEGVSQCLRECGITFCYAPLFNPVMQRLGPIRRELGIRTCFNLMGPLLNPFRVQHIVVGVYRQDLLEPMAKILQNLGVKRGAVVWSEGMDEATTLGVTEICEIAGEAAPRSWIVVPETFGYCRGKLEDLVGGDPETNAHALEALLKYPGAGGTGYTLRETVLLNAAIGLYIAGQVDTIEAGCRLAERHLDNGDAHRKLQEWRSVSSRVFT